MNRSRLAKAVLRRTERGLTLIIVLIVLVAMTLAGISMMNSVNTAGLVAGNMAFRQAALHAGDVGTEAAITWLLTHGGTVREQNIPANGYYANQNIHAPATGQTWDDLWQSLGSGEFATVNDTPNAQTGTTVSYVIHRLCQNVGPANAADCAISPSSAVNEGNSHDVGNIPINYSAQQYYRITSRIQGPRNTVSYTQTIVVL